MCDQLPPDLFDRVRAHMPPLRMPRRAFVIGIGGFALGACVRIGRERRPRPHAVPGGGRITTAPYPPELMGRPPTTEGHAPYAAPEPKSDASDTPAFDVVPRTDWGAAPLRDNHDPMASVRRITVHHTAELARMDEKTDAALVKAVQVFHQDDRGWADIGYHFLIGRDGVVYEGRPLDVQGAHAGGGNNVENLGVSLIGEFVEALPGEAQLATLRAFLTHHMAVHDVPMAEIHGHRDFKATQCPGDALYTWLTGTFKADTNDA